jgi:SEC-C motif-containing protein
MAKSGRNAPCPCGSGRKHKQCCLRRAQEQRRRGRATETVWQRLQEWTIANHPEHLEAAIDEFLGDERTITPETGDLLCSYVHLDRRLPSGRTPIERFAELPALDDVERAAARTLTQAHLGLWRVRTVEPGVSIDLEEVFGDRLVVVQSQNVSRGTARWDVLLGRVIHGAEGHELWGPAAIFTAAEEDEIVAEIERLAGDRSIAPGAVFRRCAAELLRFSPPSRTTPRSFFTFEGDEVASAYARWVLDDADAAAALEAHPDLVDMADTDDGEGVCLEWTRPRRELAARRPELPLGAVVLESTPVFVDPDERRVIADSSRIGLGTFELRPRELTFDAISVRRLEDAIALVADTLGSRARLVERSVAPLDTAGAHVGQPVDPAADDDPAVPPEIRETVVAGITRARFHRVLDEPDPRLDGLSPREAARSPRHRPAVERWLRTLENSAAHGHPADGTAPDVPMLRTELGMPDQALRDAA